MRYAAEILRKIEQHRALGADIVKNADLEYTGKLAGYSECTKIAQINDRRTRWPKRVIWACYR